MADKLKLEAAKAASAAAMRLAWGRAAVELDCSLELLDVETASGIVAAILDAETGVDYLVCRRANGVRIPVASRTHRPPKGVRSFGGWTVRYLRGTTQCEFFRLEKAVQEPFGMWPRLMIEVYLPADGVPSDEMRVCVARTSDVVDWCRQQRAAWPEEAMLKSGVLRRNPDDGVLFFAPSVANIAKSAPAWQCDWGARPSPDLFGQAPGARSLRCERGAPGALWVPA